MEKNTEMESRQKTCSVNGCELNAYVRGLCTMHYQRFMAHGDVNGGKWHLFKDEREAFMSRVKVDGNGCWTWCGERTPLGYGRFTFRGTREFAHRASMRINFPYFDCEKQVNHRCDNPSCVNPDHLYMGTQRENIRDMIDRKRIFRKGENCNGPRKLVNSDVLKIRESKMSRGELARLFGVSAQTITDVKTRRSWRHI